MSGEERRRPQRPRRLKQFMCRQCKADIGVETSTTTEVFASSMIDPDTGKLDRKMSRKLLVCAYCLGRGRITEAF